MQPFFILLIAILFCFSCASDNTASQTAGLRIDSSAVEIKDEEESEPTVDTEIKEETCFIKDITENEGQVFIHADYIIRLDGERAIEEAKKRGDADTFEVDGKMEIAVVNDYYIINDNPKIRKLLLDPDVQFDFVDFDRHEGKVDHTLQGLRLIYEDSPFILTLKNGKVIKVREIFVP